MEQMKGPLYWRGVHMAGDKSPPVCLPDTRPRRSIGTARMWRCFGKSVEVME